ncbi:MAG: right-handed parallel beta-helix repeat-containing protein, partial [Verrucomicrobia bacterium]|nr:right-handed parallel beta-helix repeat-containing protein [Verrucomicrobiota bacterium]
MNRRTRIALALGAALFTCSGRGMTYYVDDTGGDNANSGTSTNAAWQTVSAVSSRTFSPGDRILFKAGGSWTGELDLNGNGIAAHPIVVDQYGAGAKPLIDGAGYECAVRLQGVSYWEVNNLEIVNDGGLTLSGAADYRAGVLVKSAFTSIRNHIHLRNLTIHDIFPESGPYGHGIHVVAACSGSVDTYYDDVRIENCHISRTGRFGAWVQQTGSTAAAPSYRYIRNVILRSNVFENVGGSGAETGWCDGVLLENNVVNYSGASVDPRQWARGSGYWPFKCLNVLVQSNEFRHARGGGDSCGVHIDYGCTNATVQYNLSLDNEGGFVEILGDCKDATYRYNVSINDGSRVKGVGGAFQDGHLIWISNYAGESSPTKGSTNPQVYNNTIYVRPGIANYLKIMEGSQDTFIGNNIFFIDGQSTYTDAGTNTVFQNNLWYGNVPAGLPADPGAVFANPDLVNAGGLDAADYLLTRPSPARGAGAVIPDNGGFDYWGNPLPVTAPSIGANEPTFFGDVAISINLTDFAITNQQISAGQPFGIPVQNSVYSGWVDLNRTLNASHLLYSDGTPSTVDMTGTAPNGWGTCNSAYDGTPLVAGIDDYTATTNPTSVTLNHLAANFPGGYKVIAYVSGFNGNTGASISDGVTAFFYQTLNDPVTEFQGLLVQTCATNDPGPGLAPFAQYAVFGDPVLLTNDTLTLTLNTLSGSGAILGGFQVIPAGQFTAQGVPYGWFASFDVPVDDDADDDLDLVPAWQEFFAGTDPTAGDSFLKVIDVRANGADLELSWLGGVTGQQCNWSMSVSSNLTDWSVLASKTILRNPAGTNT